MDRIAAAGREATDLQRLDWLGQEDLVTALVEGRKAAGISQRKIRYALNLGTIHHEWVTCHGCGLCLASKYGYGLGK